MTKKAIASAVIGALALCGAADATVQVEPGQDGDTVQINAMVAVDCVDQLADILNQQGVAVQLLAIQDGVANMQFIDAVRLLQASRPRADAGSVLQPQPVALTTDGRCPPRVG
jgi:hypothetical protein